MYISSKILLGIAVQRMYNKYGKEKDLEKSLFAGRLSLSLLLLQSLLFDIL